MIRNILLALLLGFALIACSDDDEQAAPGPGEATGVLTAKINGESFTANTVTRATENSFGGRVYINLQGVNASGKTINMVIIGFVEPGTYLISSENNVSHKASYIESNSNDSSASTTWAAPYTDSGIVGEITVSEKTATSIMGTFSFKGKEQMGSSFREITEGRFNLDF
jgi:Family of unknown function (DUF6252)